MTSAVPFYEHEDGHHTNLNEVEPRGWLFRVEDGELIAGLGLDEGIFALRRQGRDISWHPITFRFRAGEHQEMEVMWSRLWDAYEALERASLRHLLHRTVDRALNAAQARIARRGTDNEGKRQPGRSGDTDGKASTYPRL
jgi:hypothetical protein